MSETYTYSINDNFPNHKVDTSVFTVEINQSSISSATLERIDEINGDCKVVFSGVLSAPDETTLNGLVGAHLGEPVPHSTGKAQILLAGTTPILSDLSSLSEDGDWAFAKGTGGEMFLCIMIGIKKGFTTLSEITS